MDENLKKVVFDLNKFEWVVIIFAIFLVLITEVLNTSIENLADLLVSETNTNVKIIKDIAKENRPRERLEKNGAHVLSDAELLAIIFKTRKNATASADSKKSIISPPATGISISFKIVIVLLI